MRQHAIAALNLTQQAKQIVLGDRGAGGDPEQTANTALIDGVRRFAMDVRELDIDLIDRINPFGEAYAILAKTMSEDSLKQVQAAISAKRTSLTPRRRRNSLFGHSSSRRNAGGSLDQLDGCLGKADGRWRRRLCPLQGRGPL